MTKEIGSTMKLKPAPRPSPRKSHPDKPVTRRPVPPAPVPGQPGLQDLTPLQRQRLDTAVMLLVNYLISASPRS